MSLEIGNLPPVQPPAATWRPESTRFSLDLARTNASAATDSVELSLPASPPPEILDEIGAAADRVDALAALDRELHFRKDKESGRVIIEVRDFEGNVLRTIPPSEALDVLGGGSL
jgi:uncharacterized FlaG/YvyC family protein